MLLAAKAAAKSINAKCIGVSILTSTSNEEAITLYGRGIEIIVRDMFLLANEAGCDGVVCSPLELSLAAQVVPDLIKITPGIRSGQDNEDDQTRTLSAIEAKELGADFLVIGRPITQAENISMTFDEIYRSIYE